MKRIARRAVFGVACRKGMLVAFSCTGRGLCPSCGAKRAAETANRLRMLCNDDVALGAIGKERDGKGKEDRQQKRVFHSGPVRVQFTSRRRSRALGEEEIDQVEDVAHAHEAVSVYIAGANRCRTVGEKKID